MHYIVFTFYLLTSTLATAGMHNLAETPHAHPQPHTRLSLDRLHLQSVFS